MKALFLFSSYLFTKERKKEESVGRSVLLLLLRLRPRKRNEKKKTSSDYHSAMIRKMKIK